MIRALIPLLLLATPVTAQVVCGPVEGIESELRGQNQQPALIGVTEGNKLLQIWMTIDRRTWTATVTSEAGSCIVSRGTSFEAVPMKPQGQPS